MLQDARATAGPTVFGSRIALILEELAPLEEFERMLADEEAAAAARMTGPIAIAADVSAGMQPQAYSLRHLQTGETPDVATTFTVAWNDGQLVFDIVCHDQDMDNLFVSRDVWGGDSVAILLETPFHAYYQIEINPDGEIFDADREHGRVNANWQSQAVITTERGPDFWRVKARIPVVDEAAGEGDPMNFVVGEKPAPDAPWFFNLGRVRIRDMDKSAHAFSPTGGNYHLPLKFARLVVGD